MSEDFERHLSLYLSDLLLMFSSHFIIIIFSLFKINLLMMSDPFADVM